MVRAASDACGPMVWFSCSCAMRFLRISSVSSETCSVSMPPRPRSATAGDRLALRAGRGIFFPFDLGNCLVELVARIARVAVARKESDHLGRGQKQVALGIGVGRF